MEMCLQASLGVMLATGSCTGRRHNDLPVLPQEGSTCGAFAERELAHHSDVCNASKSIHV